MTGGRLHVPRSAAGSCPTPEAERCERDHPHQESSPSPGPRPRSGPAVSSFHGRCQPNVNSAASGASGTGPRPRSVRRGATDPRRTSSPGWWKSSRGWERAEAIQFSQAWLSPDTGTWRIEWTEHPKTGIEQYRGGETNLKGIFTH